MHSHQAQLLVVQELGAGLVGFQGDYFLLDGVELTRLVGGQVALLGCGLVSQSAQLGGLADPAR